jgi:hypothetical protein
MRPGGTPGGNVELKPPGLDLVLQFFLLVLVDEPSEVKGRERSAGRSNPNHVANPCHGQSTFQDETEQRRIKIKLKFKTVVRVDEVIQ